MEWTQNLELCRVRHGFQRGGVRKVGGSVAKGIRRIISRGGHSGIQNAGYTKISRGAPLHKVTTIVSVVYYVIRPRKAHKIGYYMLRQARRPAFNVV